MADPTAANVRVGVTGGVYRGPVGTALPTDATSTINVAFKDVGFLTEDGLEVDWFSESTNDIRAWQGGALVRRVQTEVNSTIALTMLETNTEVLKAFYGDGNVSAGHVRVTNEPGVRGPWVIEVKDGAYVHRIAIDDGQITTRGQLSVVNGNAISYPITITAYPVLKEGVLSPADIYYDPSSVGSS